MEAMMFDHHSARSVSRLFSLFGLRPAGPKTAFCPGKICRRLSVPAAILLLSGTLAAQATGNAGSIHGTVTDPTGAVVPGATVQIHNPVSEYNRTATTDSSGTFTFPNVPLNPYHLTVTAQGFAPSVQDVEVHSALGVSANIQLQITGAAETINVQSEATDLIENSSTFHTDIDRSLFARLPLESTTSELSSLVTLATPGVAADSNGLFHGLGDHASNSFSLDGQPITDQQSKVFSNQIPLDAVQSMMVIAGAPPAEYGEKTSLVIDVTTRSGWVRLRLTARSLRPTGASAHRTPASTFPTGERIGAISLQPMAWTRAAFSIHQSSVCFMLMAICRMYSTGSTISFPPTTRLLVKTISSIYILKELQARRAARRLLVVCWT